MFLSTIPVSEYRARMVDVLVRVGLTYPELELRIAWKQPMFTHNGTYIIGFSAASKHMAMAPERATMIRFEPVMRERGVILREVFARQPGASLSTTSSRRTHSAPASRQARPFAVLTSEVMNAPPRTDPHKSDNLYN